MVVTDLHGDWPLYERYRDIFLSLRDQRLADTLIITGDFIHSDGPPGSDRSLEITLDLLQLQQMLGEHLIVLLGNHELPHIYHFPLSKGSRTYTPSFEAILGDHRHAVLDFFDKRPFYVRTRAGVSLCHAGAFAKASDPGAMAKLQNFSHQAILQSAAAQVPLENRAAFKEKLAEASGMPYAYLARTYLAASDPDDPRYDDYLIGALATAHPDFELLWSALFTANEREYGMQVYTEHVRALLKALSAAYTPQHVLVSGHIGCRGGVRILAEGQQLRLASGAHAHPYNTARYLLFNAGQPVGQAEALKSGLGCVFES